jgi:hypothetical protein
MNKLESHALRSQSGDWARHPDIAKALDHISLESQIMVLDALGCMFHNEGHAITGNSQDHDIEWLARRLHFKLEACGHINDWDEASPGIRAKYLFIAKECLDQLPELMSRISSRYLAWESALRTMWDIARAKKLAANNMFVQKINDPK